MGDLTMFFMWRKIAVYETAFSEQYFGTIHCTQFSNNFHIKMFLKDRAFLHIRKIIMIVIQGDDWTNLPDLM